MLGLESKSIDCVSTSGDQFFNVPCSRFPRSALRQSIERVGGKKNYSLSWIPREDRWVIENPEENPHLCCHCDGISLTSVSPSASVFADRFKIRDLVHGWSQGTTSKQVEDFEFLNQYDAALIEYFYIGDIHKAVLRRPKQIRKKWLGTEIACNEYDPINESARIAWQLSWIERWIAWEGSDDLVHNRYRNCNNGIEEKLPSALAAAMDRWPQLMRQCLALAEIIYWTFYRQGIGIAAKFD